MTKYLFKRALIVFEQQFLLSLLLQSFQNSDLIENMDCAHSYLDAINNTNNCNYDLVIIDVDIIDKKFNGFEIAKKVKLKSHNTKTLMMSSNFKIQYVTILKEVHVDGYFSKNEKLNDFEDALKTLHHGGKYVNENLLLSLKDLKVTDDYNRKLIEKYNLTEREICLIHLLCSDKNYQDIAFELNIEYDTVKTHVRNIFRKLNLHTRHEVVNFAHESGLVLNGLSIS